MTALTIVRRWQMVGYFSYGRKAVVAAVAIPGHPDMIKVHTQPIRGRRVTDVTGTCRQGMAQRLAGRIDPVMTGRAARENIPVIEIDSRPGSD